MVARRSSNIVRAEPEALPLLLDEVGCPWNAVALRLVVVDPQLRVLPGEQRGDFPIDSRLCSRLKFLRGHPPVHPVLFEVHHVPGQHHRTPFWATAPAATDVPACGRAWTRLLPSRRRTRRDRRSASPSGSRAACRTARGEFELGRVRPERRVVLGLLDVERGGGEHVGVAEWSPWKCENGEPGDLASGATPSS